MGTGLGLLARDRKTESGDMEVGPRDLGTGDGADQSPHPGFQREMGPAAPPMCPTNQVTSISEVLFPGGGSDKMSCCLTAVRLGCLFKSELRFQVYVLGSTHTCVPRELSVQSHSP